MVERRLICLTERLFSLYREKPLTCGLGRVFLEIKTLRCEVNWVSKMHVSECIGNKFELNSFKFNPIFEKYMEPRKNILD